MSPSASNDQAQNNGMNGSSPKRPFVNGVYCPLITPFSPQTEDVDYAALQKQVVRMAKAGMGLVILGTNGEASHLSKSERFNVIRSSREALDKAGYTQTPLLVGTGTGSSHQTISLCKSAAEAGADYVIVIAPGYFSFAMGRDRVALRKFFVEVLDKSPLPVMIYNFPGAASGIDLDSDFLIDLSEHQNCFGAKLTCGNLGKGHRLCAHTQSAAYKDRHPNPYFVLPGFSDILLPAMVGRAQGCITGTGNVIPKTIVKLYDTIVKALSSGNPSDMDEARKLQDLVAEADWLIVKVGIGGTKWALDHFIEEGPGGVPRSPLPPVDEGIKRMLTEKGNELVRAVEYEKTL